MDKESDIGMKGQVFKNMCVGGFVALINFAILQDFGWAFGTFIGVSVGDMIGDGITIYRKNREDEAQKQATSE